MPVIDHEVHLLTRKQSSHKYGCHDRNEPMDTMEVQDGWLPDGRARMVHVPYRMSKECRYDKSLTDPSCGGCGHAGTGEEYAAKVNAGGGIPQPSWREVAGTQSDTAGANLTTGGNHG